MSTTQRAHGGPPDSGVTHRPQTLRVFTPTPYSYERFLRGSVGLPLKMPLPSGSGALVAPYAYMPALCGTSEEGERSGDV